PRVPWRGGGSGYGGPIGSVPWIPTGDRLRADGLAGPRGMGRHQHRDQTRPLLRAGGGLHAVQLLSWPFPSWTLRRPKPGKRDDHGPQLGDFSSQLGPALRPGHQLRGGSQPLLPMLHRHPKWREQSGCAEGPSPQHPAGNLCGDP
ncbi:CCC1, partial [Symbiodinium sp. CCMP2456]